jgi:GTP-binding protein HflX
MKNSSSLHSTAEAPKEAILFGIAPHGDQRSAPEILDELQLLAETGNFVVAGSVAQHRRTPDPHTYLGRGKLEELAEIIERSKAHVAICDASLSPTQGRALEQALKVPVLDRSELILHIFGIHARTPQAKLQVELASLQYQLPRLKRMWTHLERQRGGIGLRGGAGEKQIDVDRSELRNRIAQINRDIKRMAERKSREIRARADQFTIALVGYTNAGKSTLMNRLTGANVLAENRLFSTLDTRTRPWRLAGGRTVLLSDTVGFIRNLPHQLVASFHATLEEALNADLLFVLVDASSPQAQEQLQTVAEVLDMLGATSLPQVTVLNKIDALQDRAGLATLLNHDGRAVPISAATGEGIEHLESRLQEILASSERRVEILVPHAAGALHAEIRRNTTVLSEFFTAEGCLMECLVSGQLLGRLLAKGATLRDPDNGDPDSDDRGAAGRPTP